MYIVLLRLADGDKVSNHLAGHRDWLQRGFDDGVFFLTGAIRSDGGGAILATGLSMDALTCRLAADPFVAEGVVTPEVIPIEVTMRDPRITVLSA